jgi:hypothetical protein
VWKPTQLVLMLTGAVVSGACLIGDRVCEIARGRIVAEDGRADLPCTLNVLMQPVGATDPRPIPLGPRAVKTGHDFSYRTFCPSAKLNVTIACEGYAPYESQTYFREQGAFCGPTIDIGTVTVKRPAKQATR